jgi:hypothetical protein
MCSFVRRSFDYASEVLFNKLGNILEKVIIIWSFLGIWSKFILEFLHGIKKITKKMVGRAKEVKYIFNFFGEGI